jgi:hypothetical protein
MVEAGFATAADVRAAKARKILRLGIARTEPMHTVLTPRAVVESSRANRERPKRSGIVAGEPTACPLLAKPEFICYGRARALD